VFYLLQVAWVKKGEKKRKHFSRYPRPEKFFPTAKFPRLLRMKEKPEADGGMVAGVHYSKWGLNTKPTHTKQTRGAGARNTKERKMNILAKRILPQIHNLLFACCSTTDFLFGSFDLSV
jgi:hypothetical protein